MVFKLKSPHPQPSPRLGGERELSKRVITERLANTITRDYYFGMTTTVEAIYEHGKLLLPKPLSLPEKSHVRVTIESDVEREAWLKLSEESLRKTWDNNADDVFNELLSK